MNRSSITTRGIFLLISLLIGCFILTDFIDFQHTLSTGDHGLVLYAAEATLRGELPYRDYHYFYGPFMPYYYALMLKLFGNAITSVLIGEQFLRLACGLLIYCSLSLFINPLFALAGSLWYWVFNKEFFYTYNHIGINVCSFFTFYAVCYYLKNNSRKALFWPMLACFIAGMIKLNFGMALAFSLCVSVFAINAIEKRPHSIKFYLWALLGVPSLIMLANALFLVGLPFYIVSQCYQYFGNDAVIDRYPTLAMAFFYLAKAAYMLILKSWYFELLLVMVAIAGLANIYQIKKGRMKEFGLKPLLTILLVPFLFYLPLLHEFLVSGIEFRSFYAYPFLMIMLFLALGYFARQTPPYVQGTLASAICLICLLQFGIVSQRIASFRTSLFYLPMEKAKIFVTNRTPWTQTVTQATLFLKGELKKDELFLAIPDDPLYYYLLDRKSPTRTLVLFSFLRMPPEQDRGIVEDLEKHHVNWILVSNRAVTNEAGLGLLGRDYAPILAKYINDHFEVVAQFGDWTDRPSWAWYHGVRILKRKGT